MKYYIIPLILLLSLICHSAQTLNLIRKTRYGLIQGALARSQADRNTEYHSFRGIPYGRPPVGKLRFKEPLRPKPWFSIKNTTATESRLKCVQIDDNFNGQGVVGSEDCLYLDVFEPKTARKNAKELLPVMIWIHGGTFIFGSINASGPDYLMEKPVVLVEVEYRVNVFGFLSSMDENAKGNLGLKDQLLGLQWVKENILNFGGDPNKVTIFGESAGGASVLYHMLSPRSQGLFHKAISQSGSTFNRWALQERPKEKFLRLARGLGIEDTDSKTIIEKLQKIDYRIIMEAAFNKSIVGFYTPYYAQPFGPIIEIESDTAIISESSFSLLEKGKFAKVPYIVGFNTEEGSFAYDYIVNGRTDINIYNEHPQLLIPKSMNINNGSACYQEALAQIKAFYFKNGNLTDKANWIPYMSQELFVRGILKTMELMYKHLTMYFYRISYAGSRPISHLGGVGHFEEVQYIFLSRRAGANTVESESDKLTRKRMVTFWTNYASTSDPTPEKDELLQNITWPKAYPNKAYLDIGNDLTLHENPNQPDSEFWEKLFDSCGNPPYITY